MERACVFNRIIRTVSVLVLLPVLLSACGKPESNQPDSAFQFASFRDIPGVTQDEIKAIDALREQFDSFVLGMIPSTEAFYDDNGVPRGFTALFCEWLTRLFGIPFIPENYEFNELLGKLARYEVDFTGALTATEERRGTHFMTTPIALHTVQYFRIDGSTPLEIIAQSRPPRYAMMANAYTIDLVTAKLIPGTYEIVLSTDIDEVYRMLKSGEVDAAFNTNREIAFDVYGDVVSSDFTPLLYTSASLMTRNRLLEPVISVMQKALDNGALQYLAELHNTGYQEYLKQKLSLWLSEEEIAYIRDHPTVPFAAGNGNYPVSFYNAYEKRWQGISFDMLREVEDLSGLRFELVHDQNTLWQTALSMLENGEVAMISGIIRSNTRQDVFLWADTPIMTDYYALISKSDYRDITLNEILNVKIGTIIGTSYAVEFNILFPDHKNIMAYHDTNTAIDALERGEVDMLMANEGHLLLIAHYRELMGYKVNYIFNYTFSSCFAFNRNDVILCSIVDKALRLIDTNRISDQWMNRTYDYNRQLIKAQRPWLIGSSVLFLFALALVTFLFVRNRRVGRQLEHQAEAVLAASRAKGIFLATMSHEIRTPLNAIIGMAFIVKDCVADNEKALRGVNHIMTSSHHLLGILNDILDMSKIESGKLELTHEPFGLLSACNEVADIMIHRCVEKNITFVTNIHEIKDIIILGDKLRLNQVLINLLGNSVKFTSANGEIKFITEILKESTEQAHIKFSVSDNGIGMSEKQIQKLFIPFEQADTSIAARFGGTGLGLSLSQNFVKMMGGEIRVTSELNKGSSFEFALSFDKSGEKVPLAAGEDGDENYEKVNLNGKRMLLVEDIEINRLIICELLSRSGLTIDEAENGRQAVDTFAGSPDGYYDIIMMDIQMPVLNGYEAAKEIRALEKADAKTVPIIAMTANAYKEDVEQALAAGMNGHLAKPVDKDALMETVEKILKD